jgi:hypothetical protein
MESFANNDNNHIFYYDLPFYKKINKNGSILELHNSDALSQAVKIWLASKKNERVRSLGGGIIYQHLGKVMDDDRADMIKDDIISGLKNDFNPPLIPVQVTVIPNYAKERWEIGVVAYNEDLQVGVNTKAIITNALI